MIECVYVEKRGRKWKDGFLETDGKRATLFDSEKRRIAAFDGPVAGEHETQFYRIVASAPAEQRGRTRAEILALIDAVKNKK